MTTKTQTKNKNFKGGKKLKRVYFFGNKKAEGDASMKNLLGGKGSNLAEMTNLGISVPPGFTITTEVCVEFNRAGSKLPDGLMEEVKVDLNKVEGILGSKFGECENPLLFSVRSGARISMPGMMDTVLNLGLNDETVKGMAKKTGSERFAYDSYRRFIQMFGDVVMGLEHEDFEKILTSKKKERGITNDTELSADDIKDIVFKYEEMYREHLGESFPQDPYDQLEKAITAVFNSWNTERAIKYRKLNNISEHWGTAVNVQAMVFGNLGETSATGVAFTRNPSTGENKFYGEFLMNAQGEDVVAGIRTPKQIENLAKEMPEAYRELEDIYKLLEKHYHEMQDLEFTIQDKKLFILQTRTGKRTAQAALKIAVDMVKEGLIDEKEAVMRVTPTQIDQLLHPMIDPLAKLNVIAKGLPASPGAAVGKVVFTTEDAESMASKKEKVILVRSETSPEDIGGMDAAQGILTARGGMTSHAAVVARGMGKCCVAGCGALSIDEKNKKMVVGDRTEIKEGDFITLNGTKGEVILGEAPLIKPELSGDFTVFMGWADKLRKLKVRTNADTPHDTKVARDFGAQGIGLCRTEHMFFEGDRIKAMREMILAENTENRVKALDKLLPMQRGDFIGIFKAMEGYQVTIRLLDPPLHEFLPHTKEAQEEMAKEIGISQKEVERKVTSLHEFNPMLGHRGCRLGITYPEIYQMQVRAIIEAAIELKQKENLDIMPEIMIPLIGTVGEFNILKEELKKVIEAVMKEKGVTLKYLIGTMIEIPRAALMADKIAQEAEFFSFGTNDLTQMAFGYSRDDAGVFLPSYVEKGILPSDPFQVLDIEGVGQLVKMGVERGRKTRPDLKVGICGEHGGEPTSIEFCHKVGLDYVSCSPYRVPIARLAAAQAVLKEQM